MNINKLIKLFKKKGKIILFNDKDVQWISDGAAVYPLWRFPRFDEQSFTSAYGLTEGVTVEVREGLPEKYDFSDISRVENQVFYEKIQLPISGGNKVVSLFTQAGVTFVDRTYLDPIEDDGYMGLYERLTSSGELYIVVKRGMMLEAVIMPMKNVIHKDYLDDLQELVSRLIDTYNEEVSAGG